MHHTWEGHDRSILTTAKPEEGALELVARLRPEAEFADETAEYPSLNVCWQLRSAPSFASKPDPYPEFIKRCFILTERGRTFLHETERRKIPVQSPEHEHNNPPWVQMYRPLGTPDVRAGTGSWADYSPDQFLYPVIGAISRDGKFLTAIASGSAGTICQAWHDCMHNNPKWQPSSGHAGKQWRIRVYAMENDPEALLDRFKEDFPEFKARLVE